MNLVIVGAGRIVSDVFDCAHSIGIPVSRIVVNQVEIVRPRTLGLDERLASLGQAPEVVHVDEFRPHPGEVYALGTSSPSKAGLVELFGARFGIVFESLIHRTAYVSPYARVGRGVFVGPMSVVAPGADIRDYVFVNRGVTVGHDTVVGEYSRLMVGCNVGGHVAIGRGSTIGLGAAVLEERVVGHGAFVATGSIVTKDVADDVFVAGSPARPLRRLDAG
jgi:sugar O-acyltransferase (sialic acid O-acetyltransferase NeuD family)